MRGYHSERSVPAMMVTMTAATATATAARKATLMQAKLSAPLRSMALSRRRQLKQQQPAAAQMLPSQELLQVRLPALGLGLTVERQKALKV